MAAGTLSLVGRALAGLVFALGWAWGQAPQLKEAGVCARCHVAQVLEWSVAAKHGRAGTNCAACHGASAGHVANERNQVKPERLPVGAAAVAALCASCHGAGCPKTGRREGCASCHHAHALTNPQAPAAKVDAAGRDEAYRAAMATGERRAAAGDWAGAREAFGEALRVSPKDPRAAGRRRMAERRERPEMAGLEVVGAEFDGESGLARRVRVKGLGMEMRLVGGGVGEMGSEAGRGAGPVHEVYVEPYYLGVFEVTQAEWEWAGMENRSTVKGGRWPVYGISWEEAREFVRRVNAKTGGSFRLPTEAEWERAARLGGEGALGERAWYRENTGTGAGPFREMGAYAPREVGTRRANAGGFFDLAGNVAEWCSSLFRPYPYDGRDGREGEGEGLRVVRGGAYGDGAEAVAPGFRHSERPGRRSAWTGLRLAR